MKNHKKLIILILSFFILSVIEVHALENTRISIFLEKSVYGYGDTVHPVITVSNNKTISVTLNFYEEIRNIEGKIPPYFISPKQIIVPAKTSLNVSEIYFVITDFNPSGEYQVKAEIRENNNLLNSATRTFTINSIKSLDFTLFTCKDISCIDKAKVFTKNENIYLDYKSEVSGISISALLTMPDKSAKQISLPTSIKAEQIGTYTLKVTASKPVYKTTEKTIQFGVIEQEANINQLAIAEEGKKEVPEEEKKVDYSLIIALSFVIIIIIGIIFAYKKLKLTKGN
jgi:hypothetical protein